jgi:hypothetical protein
VAVRQVRLETLASKVDNPMLWWPLGGLMTTVHV